MKTCFTILSILFLSGINLAFYSGGTLSSQYKLGLQALAENNEGMAITYFKNSVYEFADAPSFFELAKIYIGKNNPAAMVNARRFMKKAVAYDPANLEYRYHYAELLEKFTETGAFDEYREILKIDSTQAKAWLKMATFKEEDFNDYHLSVKTTGGPLIEFESFAREDFIEAEAYFKKSLEYDSLNYDAMLHMAFLYEDAGLFGKGRKIAEKLVYHFPQEKDAYLIKGLLSYKDFKIEQANADFEKAISLMTQSEKDDFLFLSVDFLLDPVLEKYHYNDRELEYVKQKYWEISDPALLTEYNERLIEHYARVAYANLRFSVPSMGIKGWESDRGRFYVRFGEPLKRVRYRPQIGDDFVVKVKTDVWDYGDHKVGFDDEYFSGNFRFSVPGNGSRISSQFDLESEMIAGNMERANPERYNPKFEGPVFDIALSINQFRNSNFEHNGHTDVYFNYLMPLPDSLDNTAESYNHKTGLFFFDKHFSKKYEARQLIESFKPLQKIEEPGNQKTIVNSINMSLKADSGSMAFEVMRDVDNGIYSNHKAFTIKSFEKSTLAMSDVMLASSLSFDADTDYPVTRNNIGIIPNPSAAFGTKDKVFIYYEIYNLGKDADELTDFNQLITVQPVRSGSDFSISALVSSLKDFIGIESDNDKITLSSSYQTETSDAPMYLQLDTGNYSAGKYLLTVTILDNINGQMVSSKTTLILH